MEILFQVHLSNKSDSKMHETFCEYTGKIIIIWNWLRFDTFADIRIFWICKSLLRLPLLRGGVGKRPAWCLSDVPEMFMHIWNQCSLRFCFDFILKFICGMTKSNIYKLVLKSGQLNNSDYLNSIDIWLLFVCWCVCVDVCDCVFWLDVVRLSNSNWYSSNRKWCECVCVIGRVWKLVCWYIFTQYWTIC